ncbi:hypothetical protein LSTR_LSTR016011 [Laodelphax striatellus]|uniref:Uncharacterized protein n=1 Tax=Laodelphax striatellus TaxID=195883 RepID=A0A482WN40_LAOST|nr:hypothetical protein LSTR_LSTR016011 [Laodelphax striatellus]
MRKTTELKDEESTTIYTHNMRTNNDETSTETVESTTKRKPDGAKNENNDESSSRKVKITDNEAGKESYTATLDDKDLHLLRDFMKKHMNIK